MSKTLSAKYFQEQKKDYKKTCETYHSLFK